MTLILDRTQTDAPRVLGVVCDCCKADIRDDIDLHEVIHARLRAGYGSAWGDGNIVEVDLCDACGHRLLKPYANVVPSSERLSGHVVVGLDPAMVTLGALHSPNVLFKGSPEDAAMLRNTSGAWAWVRFQTLRYFIPACVLLQPIVSALRRFWLATEREDLKLRLRFGRQ